MSARRAGRPVPPMPLRGAGYMPKGGADAARAHNERARATAHAARVVIPPEPTNARTDARAGASAGRALIGLWGAALGTGLGGLVAHMIGLP